MAYQKVNSYRISINMARGVVIRVKVENSKKLETVSLGNASPMAVDTLISLLQGPNDIACDLEKGLFKTL